MAFTDPVFQWLAYELAAIFGLITLWLLFRQARKSRQIARQTAQAVEKLKHTRETRRQQLADLIQEHHGLEGEPLEAQLDMLLAHERQLFKHALNLYIAQDATALEQLNQGLQSHLDNGLAMPTPLFAADTQTQLLEENARLQATIDALNQQLVWQPSENAFNDSVTDLPDENIDDAEVFNDDSFSADLQPDDFEVLLAGTEIELTDLQQTESDAETGTAEQQDVILSDEVQDTDSVHEAIAAQTDLLAEIEAIDTIEPKTRLADFAKSDWQPVTPDVYGKQISDNRAEPRQVAAQPANRLRDFAKSAWVATVPDVYGRTAISASETIETPSQSGIPVADDDVLDVLSEIDLDALNDASLVTEIAELVAHRQADTETTLDLITDSAHADFEAEVDFETEADRLADWVAQQADVQAVEADPVISENTTMPTGDFKRSESEAVVSGDETIANLRERLRQKTAALAAVRHISNHQPKPEMAEALPKILPETIELQAHPITETIDNPADETTEAAWQTLAEPAAASDSVETFPELDLSDFFEPEPDLLADNLSDTAAEDFLQTIPALTDSVFQQPESETVEQLSVSGPQPEMGSINADEVMLTAYTDALLADVDESVADPVTTDDTAIDFAEALAREAELAAQEKIQTEAEMASFDQQTRPAVLPDEKMLNQLLTDVAQLRQENAAAIQSLDTDNLEAAANTPLPEQNELDQLMDEVRQLQKQQTVETLSEQEQQQALRNILSAIPSFAEPTKKPH